MKKTNTGLQVADEAIMNKIYLLREKKIMLDKDLAELYGVETKRLKEAVRRNIDRFPDDFMFEMSKEELNSWRETTNNSSDKMGLRYLPFCFTEQGVTMLSCVLNSKRAVEVNIHVIRIFTLMREILLSNKDILLRLEMIEKRLTESDEQISILFSYLKKMLSEPKPVRRQIGFLAKDD